MVKLHCWGVQTNHRHVYGADDAGDLIFGRVGKEILAVAFMGSKLDPN